jgi:hypothetical protein
MCVANQFGIPTGITFLKLELIYLHSNTKMIFQYLVKIYHFAKQENGPI